MSLHLGTRKIAPSKKKKEPCAAYGSAEHRRKISEGLKRHHAAKRKGKKVVKKPSWLREEARRARVFKG